MNDVPETVGVTPEPQPLVVTAAIPMTRDEYLSAQKYVGKQSRLFRWAWPVTVLFMAYITMALAANYISDTQFTWIATWTVFAVIGGIAMEMLSRKRRKQAVEDSYAFYRTTRGEQTDQLRFYADHLEYISLRRRLSIPYDDVLAFREDEQKFALYTDTTIVVLPGRSLTAAQAETVYNVLIAGVAGDRIFCRKPLRPLLAEPIAVPEIPDRPVTPPQYFNRPPLKMEEQRVLAELNQSIGSVRLVLSVLAGLITAMLVDPNGTFMFTEVLCMVAWTWLSLLPVVLYSRHVAKTVRPRTIGMSLGLTGITLYLPHGEMFVRRDMLSVRNNGEALVVQTPYDVLYLRFADMASTTQIEQYFRV